LRPIIYATAIPVQQGFTRTPQRGHAKTVPLTAMAALMEFPALVVIHRVTSGCLAKAVTDVYQHRATISLSQLRHSHVLKVARGASLHRIALTASLASTSLAMDTAIKVVQQDTTSPYSQVNVSHAHTIA